MKKRGFGCTTFIFLFILMMGVLFLVITLNGMELAEDSASWSSTTGTIEDTWIERELRDDPDGMSESYYKPFIRYSYVVNGATLSSTRVDFGSQPSYSSSSRAEDYLDDYPVGKEIEVFYDPDDPGEAVLIREARGATWNLIIGIAMIVVSVVGWVGALVKKRRAPAGGVIDEFINS